MTAYSDRWTAAVLSGVYGRRELAPEIAQPSTGRETQLIFTYNQPIVWKSWNGRTGPEAAGFSFMEGDRVLTDVQVASTKVDGARVIVELDRRLPANLRVNYGSGVDGQGKVTLRALPPACLCRCFRTAGGIKIKRAVQPSAVELLFS